MNQQNYPAPPFVPPPPTRPPWNGKTNGFSIAALTLSLFGCTGLLSIVFGFIGLTQSRRNGDKRGRIFAIIALSICALWITAIATAIVVAVVRDAADGPDRDATGAIRGERTIRLADLRAGDCAKDLEDQRGSRVDVLPCTSAHSSEVFATFELPAAGDTQEAAEAGCEQRFAAYAGKKRPDGAPYFLFTARLSDVTTTTGHGVLCFAHQLHGTTTTSIRK
ncbi:DUF4190 domain-containing protein [Paractinoplanes lichenicola]|uniref:DUF4190 domain-containing protein n=1 Tax=Paractinoplanes lichenicola TaxID=2802976 RepID=A0ABS1VT92_9ACTN|nr:DUF4190 domain-containing protein [Actinoplanes lichenicola]MBL7257688.1 DUF4190 domain-containing protein [Actinoplanes lichenicola]